MGERAAPPGELTHQTAFHAWLALPIVRGLERSADAPVLNNNMKKSVLIVDSQVMLMDFLATYLEREFPDLIFSKAASIHQAQIKMFHHAFDVVVTDLLGMESTGISLTREIKRKHPGTQCIVLSTDAQSFWVHRALEEGALGFVSKSSPASELVNALKTVLQGRRYLSPDVAFLYLSHVSHEHEKDPLKVLSARELEVFVLVGRGKSFKAVSELLNMSVRTVAVHKHHIAKKTGIDSSAKIARYCAENGLLGDRPNQQAGFLKKPGAADSAVLGRIIPFLVPN